MMEWKKKRKHMDMNLIEKVTNRMIGNDEKDWGMNLNHFDWVPGVGLYGIWKAYEITKRADYLEYLQKWAKENLHKAYEKKTVNSTAPCLTILELYHITGKAEYGKVCEDLADYIYREAPRTVDGGLEHTVTERVPELVNQMWADTLFMVCIFMARMGKYQKRKEYTDFAVKQLILHYTWLWNEEDGLFYHAWNGTVRNHMSAVYWGRANAWIVYSTLAILEDVGEFEGREEILRRMKRHLQTLCHWQREDGMFGTILNDTSSYAETSATAGIACGMKMALRLEESDEIEQAAERAMEALRKQIEEDGTVLGVSTGTPVMKNAEEYRRIAICPTLYGQGLMILTLAADMEE